ncbi:MAG: tetratricopeptide repeat protein [Sphingobacteriaceae bacterium]|nr:MAG: tetratricopeptide repeat protein [Sphingobacteriaceae bacterium]
MKIKFLIVGMLGLVSATTYAQKSELKIAKDEYDKYEGLKGTSGGLAATSLNTAKTAVDKASANVKTSIYPQTYALKGAIYAALAAQDSVPATSAPLIAAAEEALKKAKEVDTKGENKSDIENGYKYLAQSSLNKGVKEYQTGKYDLAYTSFDKYRQILPEDTNAIYYTGLAAANAATSDAKFIPLAVSNYTKLLTTKFSKADDIYYELSTLQLIGKDTVAALKTVTEGIAKYPSKSTLRAREIEINLITGKGEDVISKIQAAIANEPNNKSLYYYAGVTYAKLADVIAEKQKKTKVATSKAALQPKKTEYYNKASEMYKKALELDPKYADAALNLGYVMVNPAIDAYNAANGLPATKQKEYEAGITASNKLFDAAKPYLDKAIELNPKSADAYFNLKTYYLGKKDLINANKTQKQIEALGAGN